MPMITSARIIMSNIGTTTRQKRRVPRDFCRKLMAAAPWIIKILEAAANKSDPAMLSAGVFVMRSI